MELRRLLTAAGYEGLEGECLSEARNYLELLVARRAQLQAETNHLEALVGQMPKKPLSYAAVFREMRVPAALRDAERGEIVAKNRDYDSKMPGRPLPLREGRRPLVLECGTRLAVSSSETTSARRPSTAVFLPVNHKPEASVVLSKKPTKPQQKRKKQGSDSKQQKQQRTTTRCGRTVRARREDD